MAKKEKRHAEHFDKLSASLVSASANIEAPYELPDGWKWCRLGDVCEKIKRGKSPKYTDKSKTLVFAQKCNQPDGTMSLEKALFLNEELLSKYKDDDFVKDGDILINSTGTGTIGRVGYFDKKLLPEGMNLVSDTHVTTVRACINNAPKFFYYFIKQKESYLELKGVGTTNMKELHADVLENLPFPLPPTLAEQQRIVNRIETMFAKLDQAQEKAQAVLDSFETRKAAILHKAFSGQLRIDNEELTIDDWEEKKLEDVLIEKPRNGYSTTAVDYETPYKTMSLSATTSGYFRPEFYKYIEADISDDSFLWLKPGDILIQRANSLDKVGTSAIYTGGEHEFIYPDLMMKLQVRESVSNAFIAYQLKTEESLAYFRNNATGTAGNMPKINQKTVCNLPIKLPPLNYQLSIVNFLDSVLEKESRAKEAAQSVLDQIALLKKSILARAFRGEL